MTLSLHKTVTEFRLKYVKYNNKSVLAQTSGKT